MFQEGDEVKIIPADGYCPYSYTRPESKGIVVGMSDYGRVSVKWIFFPTFPHHVPTIYDVEPQYLKLTKESSKVVGKYDRIIAKMKQMEAKRKSLGYKTYG